MLKRASSVQSVIEDEQKGELVKDEQRGVGHVSFAIYMLYISAAGGLLLFIIYIVLMFSFFGINTGSTFWLALWSNQNNSSSSSSDKHSSWYYLGYYALIQMSSLVALLISLFFSLMVRLKASVKLHNNLLQHLLHAPMVFFDTTPLGRIINRFSQDIYAVDQAVPNSVSAVVRVGGMLIVMAISVCIASPYFGAALLPFFLFYYYLQKYFIATSRELRRLSALMNSPIFSHFGESLTGSATIRAFGKVEDFCKKNRETIDNDHKAYYPSFAGNRWLGIRLETIGNFLIGSAALSCAISKLILHIYLSFTYILLQI